VAGWMDGLDIWLVGWTGLVLWLEGLIGLDPWLIGWIGLVRGWLDGG
jgi:hypothetical protein